MLSLATAGNRALVGLIYNKVSRMNPYQYLHEIVIPTVAEFEAAPADTRRAMLACTVCYHMVDAIAVAEGIKDPRVVYDRLVPACPALKTLKAVSLLTKHLAPKQTEFKGAAIADVKVGRGAAFSDGSYYGDGASHSDAPARAILESGIMRKTDLLHEIQICISFFKTELAA